MSDRKELQKKIFKKIEDELIEAEKKGSLDYIEFRVIKHQETIQFEFTAKDRFRV